jgi:hypothetical protein
VSGLVEDREIELCQVDELDVEGARGLREFGEPLRDGWSDPPGPSAGNDDLEDGLGHGGFL